MAQVRKVQAGDTPAIRELTRQLGYDVPADEFCARVEELTRQLGNAVLVAEAGGTVVGYAVLALRHDLAYPKWAELMDLCVDERSRGQGVGALLLRACEEWAREHACGGITLGTRDTRHSAHRFYEREGFTLEKLHRIYKKTL